VSAAWRFLWTATSGYRLRPWRSPYLRWRIETYSGLHAEDIGFADFWRFLWRERGRLVRFLGWTGEMRSWAETKRSPQ
jgi:hypothetical protein